MRIPYSFKCLVLLYTYLVYVRSSDPQYYSKTCHHRQLRTLLPDAFAISFFVCEQLPRSISPFVLYAFTMSFPSPCSEASLTLQLTTTMIGSPRRPTSCPACEAESLVASCCCLVAALRVTLLDRRSLVLEDWRSTIPSLFFEIFSESHLLGV